jgi:hypothetical protein
MTDLPAIYRDAREVADQYGRDRVNPWFNADERFDYGWSPEDE